MYAACGRVGHAGQFVGVGVFEFGQAAVLENGLRQGKVFGQFFEHLFIGAGRAAGCFFDDGQPQFRKEDFANLLGRTEVEGAVRQRVSLLLQFEHAAAQVVALDGELLGVNGNAGALHFKQNGAGGHLQCINALQACVGLNLRPQRLVHLQAKIHIFAGVGGSLIDADLAERNLAGAFAAQIFVADAASAQITLCQAFQPVRLVGFEHIALQQGVVHIAPDGDAVVSQHMAVVFDVLAQFGLAGVFQPGAQFV